jgi:type II secretory pathway pseudopilin PulG
MVELLVSVTILILISAAVASDIMRTRHREELASSARMMLGVLRGLQARALAATSVKTCNNGSVEIVCEMGNSVCGAAPCTRSVVPMAVGATLQTNQSSFSTFAEVDVFLEDRREDAANREFLGERAFSEQIAGSQDVTVLSLLAGGSYVSEATVTFDRQNGIMRINACGTPPSAPPCAGTEPTTLQIVLRHKKTGITNTVMLNTLTGKIEIQ